MSQRHHSPLANTQQIPRYAKKMFIDPQKEKKAEVAVDFNVLAGHLRRASIRPTSAPGQHFKSAVQLRLPVNVSENSAVKASEAHKKK